MICSTGRSPYSTSLWEILLCDLPKTILAPSFPSPHPHLKKTSALGICVTLSILRCTHHMDLQLEVSIKELLWGRFRNSHSFTKRPEATGEFLTAWEQSKTSSNIHRSDVLVHQVTLDSPETGNWSQENRHIRRIVFLIKSLLFQCLFFFSFLLFFFFLFFSFSFLVHLPPHSKIIITDGLGLNV